MGRISDTKSGGVSVKRVGRFSPFMQNKTQNLREVIALFLRLGTTSFGGPAAHIALMHHEIVARKNWVTEQEFLDLNSAANLIPGPNSTELAIHLGYVRAGWLGLLAAGVSFIVPAMVMVMALAWAYVQFGATPQVDALFYGIKPVVIVIVVRALWLLGRKAIKNIWMGLVGLAVVVLYFSGVNEILLLVAAGLLIWGGETTWWKNKSGFLIPPTLGPALSFGQSLAHLVMSGPVPTLPLLFLTFLKIGSVLYGSGYVLLAFLQKDFVENLGWLTQKQLLDAVAIGQITPGPVFTTATFIGYLVGGVPGALLATLGIFLPGFVFVAITTPFLPRLRKSKELSALLDGVNVASAGLMAGVTLQLARAALVDVPTLLIGVAAFGCLRLKINPFWLVLGGAIAGFVLSQIPR